MTTPANERFLIVNADDFGLTSSINRGIIEAHEHGIVTSASLMVRAPAAREAADYARQHPRLSLGLHLDLAEWRYQDGEWFAVYQFVDPRDAQAVQNECERQLAEFENLTGRGPSHLDSHQHAHLCEPARSVACGIASERGIPLRSCTQQITYCGGFYGQTGEGAPNPDGIASATLVRLIAELAPGWTEFGVHPGYTDGVDSVYREEREEEVRVLRSPEVRAALQSCGVQLRSFRETPIVDAPPRGIEDAPRFRVNSRSAGGS